MREVALERALEHLQLEHLSSTKEVDLRQWLQQQRQAAASAAAAAGFVAVGAHGGRRRLGGDGREPFASPRGRSAARAGGQRAERRGEGKRGRERHKGGEMGWLSSE